MMHPLIHAILTTIFCGPNAAHRAELERRLDEIAGFTPPPETTDQLLHRLANEGDEILAFDRTLQQ